MGTAAPRITRFVALLVLGFLSHPALPASAAPDAGPYLIHLERGDSIQALRLEPATFGMIAPEGSKKPSLKRLLN